MVELGRFPYIKDQSGTLAYGGSQKWFFTKWRRLAGCAAVSAANIAAYYELGTHSSFRSEAASDLINEDEIGLDIKSQPHALIYGRKDYLDLMSTMFGYMKPGFMGFPDRNKYEERFLSYADTCHRRFTADHLQGWTTTDAPLAFIEKHLQDAGPIALLVLKHNAKELDEETWHWMTITGLDREKDQILISNYGRRQILPADLLLAPLPGNDVKLTAFSPF